MAKKKSTKNVRTEDIDSAIERNRAGMAMFFFLCVLLAAVVPGIIVAFLFSYTGWTGAAPLGFIIGAASGEHGFAKLAPRFFVIVPQAQAFVGLNNLATFWESDDPYVTFGPGSHFSWPWLSRDRRSNISTQIITIGFKEEVPGKDTQLIVSGSYQFKVDLVNAQNFVGVDESTIRGGAIDLILSEISQALANEDADTAKSMIKTYNDRLGEKFGVDLPQKSADPADPNQGTDPKTESHRGDPRVADFEIRYGIFSIAVTISGIDLPPDVQKTRDAADEANQAIKSVAKMFGMDEDDLRQKIKNGDIKIDQLMDMVSMTFVQGGAAKMDIHNVKLGGVTDTIQMLAKIWGKGEK